MVPEVGAPTMVLEVQPLTMVLDVQAPADNAGGGTGISGTDRDMLAPRTVIELFPIAVVRKVLG